MSKNRDWGLWIAELDTQIRGGLIGEVQSALREVEGPSVPADLRHQFANLCRRVGFAPLGLRVLAENVLLDGELRRQIRPEDLIEYAIGLQRVGAAEEATQLLKSVDSERFPEVDLYLAFCAMGSWDYRAALDCLDRFLQQTNGSVVDPYPRFVARLNRLECLLINELHENLEESSAELQRELREEGHHLLLGNALEIEAQSRVVSGRFNEALESLAKARLLIPESNSADSLFISKWTAIAKARRDNKIESIQQARAEALQLGHWETLRDLDFHGLRIMPSQELACWVYFGTPYMNYRRSFQKYLNWQPPEETWVSNDVILGAPQGPQVEVVIEDVEHGRGGLAHRLLMLLASDFYRPFRGGEIFARLFSSERFNPVTSMNRVHQQIGEARQLIVELGWPFRIEESSGRYSLRWTASGKLWVRNQTLNLDADAIQVNWLFRKFEGKDFSTQQAATAMSKSVSSVRSLLARCCERSLLGRYGNGASIRYHFMSETP